MNTISEVVESKACSGCGICVAACPENAIEIVAGCTPKFLLPVLSAESATKSVPGRDALW